MPLVSHKLLARLFGVGWADAPVRLARIEVVYTGSFTVHASDLHGCVAVELAWSRKAETVFTEDGATWSWVVVAGPGIDRVLVEEENDLPTTTVGDVSVTYPIVLGERRGTVRTTGVGVVRLPATV